ncbi:S-protein homolog 24-like [Abrus precatorius]|uniref:S-protein homolog n=1 Tax=Abrus precatorius TaxID=3816 RepID=A0A8B8KIQ1_ABRPR|nr:S-protein homolog 24-like [Abrus precatorius]
MLKGLATVVVLLMIIATDTVQVQGFPSGKKTVRVQNDLDGGTLLYLHCRSKDNDLGLHVLATQTYQEWSFHDNVSGTTLFWCKFQFDGVAEVSFEIYSAKTDDSQCGSQCWRSIRKDGAYFYDEYKKIWVRRYSW